MILKPGLFVLTFTYHGNTLSLQDLCMNPSHLQLSLIRNIIGWTILDKMDWGLCQSAPFPFLLFWLVPRWKKKKKDPKGVGLIQSEREAKCPSNPQMTSSVSFYTFHVLSKDTFLFISGNRAGDIYYGSHFLGEKLRLGKIKGLDWVGTTAKRQS